MRYQGTFTKAQHDELAVTHVAAWNVFCQALYEQSLHIKSAIPHPLIMGVIRGRW